MRAVTLRGVRLRALLIFAVALVCVPSAVSASGSPTQLLASILAAARAAHSVHYVSSASLGASHVSQVGDAGATQGIQRITFRNAGKTGHLTVIFVANSAYLRGDAFTLIDYLGFKAGAAAAYADRWILVPHSDGAYSTIAAGVTFSAAIGELELSAPLTRVPDTTIGGRRVVGVRGKSSTTPGSIAATLYARAAGQPLPVREVATAGKTRAVVTFSRWNEPVHVAVPASAVSISKVRLHP
jgi:hypothetical protein